MGGEGGPGAVVVAARGAEVGGASHAAAHRQAHRGGSTVLVGGAGASFPLAPRAMKSATVMAQACHECQTYKT